VAVPGRSGIGAWRPARSALFVNLDAMGGERSGVAAGEGQQAFGLGIVFRAPSSVFQMAEYPVRR
jgi:hypothetical protein